MKGPSNIFGVVLPPPSRVAVNGEGREGVVNEETNNGIKIPYVAFHTSSVKEDIALMQNLGFAVDDNNAPAPDFFLKTTNQ